MPTSPAPRVAPSTRAAALVLALGLLTASGAPAQAGAQAAVPPSSPSALARARADSARLPYTAADIAFMRNMIGHHSQAIAMAELAPARSASPAVQRLATRIINAQRDEITIMQRWLADRRQPVPAPGAHDMAAMPGMAMAGAPADEHAEHAAQEHAGHQMAGMAGMSDSAAAGGLMPGMLTPAQMARLAEARGVDFDRLFLSGMIQHHQGAVGMVRTLFGTYGAGQDETVFKFASDVNVDQSTEITRMQGMLAALLTGNDLP